MPARLGAVLCVVLSLPTATPTTVMGNEDAGSYQKKEQSIDVMSTPGAICTLVRDGQVLQVLHLPEDSTRRSRLDVAHVDLTRSKHEIKVTCSHAGFEDKSEVISYGPSVQYWANPPCDPPEVIGAEAAEACLKRNANTRHVEYSYPEVVRLILEPLKN